MRRIAGPLVGLTLLSGLAIMPVSGSSFVDRIDLPDGWRPEGITSDGTTLYVGSLADGAMWRGTLTSGTGAEFIEGVPGRMAVGIDHEAAHDRLWVAGGNDHTIRVYDATTGELLEEYTFDSGFVNDIVVTEDAAYATDSNIQQLLVVPLGPDGELPDPAAATTVPLTGDITYQAGFNANGIASARGSLVVVQSNTGLVFAVDPETAVANHILLTDGGAPYLVTNGDGIEVRGNTLAVVRNQDNLVATFRLSGGLTSGTLTGELTGDFAVPTTATRAAGDLWVVNARFGVAEPDAAPYWIARVPGS